MGETLIWGDYNGVTGFIEAGFLVLLQRRGHAVNLHGCLSEYESVLLCRDAVLSGCAFILCRDAVLAGCAFNVH